VIDLGSVQNIDAIDMVPGYYRPEGDETGLFRFDVSFNVTLKYSLNGADFNLISPSTTKIELSTGNSVSLEEDALGDDFRARYLKLELESVEPVIWNGLVWPVTFAIFSIYTNVVHKGEAKLVPVIADPLTEVQDTFNLRDRIGDKLYKDVTVREDLVTLDKTNARALRLLQEFNKNHTRVNASLLYHPGMRPGVTVYVQDPVTGIRRNYFVEQVTTSTGALQIRLAYYP
jgi:hypothetical protein